MTPLMKTLARVRLRAGLLLPSVLFRICDRCALSCLYCDNGAENYGGDLPPARARQYLASLRRQLGPLRVSLTGGEPLLHPDPAGLVAACRTQALKVSLCTSGAIEDFSILDRLQSAGLDELFVPVPSLRRTTYETITGKPSFDRFERFLKALVSGERRYRIVFLVTMHRHNVDEVPELLGQLPTNRRRLAVLQPLGPTFFSSEDRSGSLELNQAQREKLPQLLQCLQRDRKRLHLLNSFLSLSMLTKDVGVFECSAGRRSLTLDQRGRVYRCLALPSCGQLPGKLDLEALRSPPCTRPCRYLLCNQPNIMFSFPFLGTRGWKL